LKLPVTLATTHQTVVIDVEPAIYNRARTGTEYFQSVIIDLTRQQLPRDVSAGLTWDQVEVGEPGQVST
jgi:hypothetical protein